MAWTGTLVSVAPGMHEIPVGYTGAQGALRMRVPGRVVASDELLAHIRDDLALEQLAHVATLPGIVGHALAMPDIHLGYGFPIGGVAAFDETEGVVSPGGVGFDINCGVRLLATPLQVDDVRPRLKETVDALFDAIPCGMGSRGGTEVPGRALDAIMSEGAGWAVENGFAHPADLDSIEERGRIEGAAPASVSERARVRGRRSLGSLGSGNHFAEIQYVDETYDDAACKAYGLRRGQVLVMVHTGSRGLGHQVCQDAVADLQDAPARYGFDLPDRQLACAPVDSPPAQAYLGAMAAAANFAFVNRSILVQHVRRAIARLYGVDEDDMPVVYDVCHNIAKWEAHRIPAGPHEGSRRRVLVHRKGATRAFAAGHPALAAVHADVGQPVVVPGDMGRASFVLAASAGAGEQTFGSCCHGAGRRLSRSQAKREWKGQELIDRLWSRDGIFVRAATPTVAAEEAPDAYKDVAQVVDAVELAGLARKAARLRPMGVVKG